MTSNALAYVMARLIGGALRSPDALSRPTLVYADRHTARQMVKGASVFGAREAEAIRKGAAVAP